MSGEARGRPVRDFPAASPLAHQADGAERHLGGAETAASIQLRRLGLAIRALPVAKQPGLPPSIPMQRILR
jgi:hypothetical protein